MNTTNVCVVIFFYILTIAVAMADIDQSIKTGLASADPLVRKSSVQRLFDSLGTVNGQGIFQESIPILIGCLSDSNISVRREAAAGLLLITSDEILRGDVKKKNELLANQALRNSLLRAIDDADMFVRQTALRIYAFVYGVTPDIEEKIITESKTPEKTDQPSDTAALLELLMLKSSHSLVTINYLNSLLDDAHLGPIVAERMSATGCKLSDATLRKLVDNLSKATNPAAKDPYVNAIGVYSKQARPYRTQLQKELTKSTDDILTMHLQQVISNLN